MAEKFDIARFEELIQESGMTVKEIIDKLGISRPTLSRWRNGKGVPSPVSIKKIAVTFNSSVSFLTGMSDVSNSGNHGVGPSGIAVGGQAQRAGSFDPTPFTNAINAVMLQDMTPEQAQNVIEMLKVALGAAERKLSQSKKTSDSSQ